MTLPRPGDYGVVKTPGIGPWIIRLVTGSWADHAFIVIDSAGGIIEAEPGGVRKGNLAAYTGCRMAFNTAEPTTAEQRAAVVEYARQRVGTPYNWDADLDDGLSALGIHWGLLAKMAAGRRAIMCSQLVARAGLASDLPGWECRQADPAFVTPAKLQQRIESQDW